MSSRQGFIYIAKSSCPSNEGLLKVGRSKDPHRRMKTLASSGMLETFSLISMYPCSEYVMAEREVFKILAKHRVRPDKELFDSGLERTQSVCKSVTESINLGQNIDPALSIDYEEMDTVGMIW